MTEQFYNGAQWTLRTAVSSSDVTLPWTSIGAVGASPTFRLIIGTEIVIVNSVSFVTTSFDVTRGAEGTTAVAHSVGEVATAILTAGAIAQLKADTLAASGSAGATDEVQASNGSGGFTAPGGVRAASETLTLGTGTLIPTTGNLRFAVGKGFATVRNISNTDDKTLWFHDISYGVSTKEHLYLGCDSTLAPSKCYDVVHQNANDRYDLRIAGTQLFTLTLNELELAVAKTTWGPVNLEVTSALPLPGTLTVSATPLTVVSLILEPDSVYDVIVTVVGRNDYVGGTPGDCYRADLSATYQRIGTAAASLVGAAPVETNKKSFGGGSAYSATLTTATGSAAAAVLNVVVTGVAATNIRWSALAQMQRVG